ncbi:MAG: 16S rRNA (cytidine(1402)-2'-O)-methyltransferase [Chloroflexi bacterium]|nr:16S rRNA (cytidine(1402)-2'-O)-methyltransferase [Chloroflexota bacterium]
MGILYLVGTPIGNLEDITLRALRVLGAVSFVMAEDTRSARTLLGHHGMTKPVTSLHDFTSGAKLARLVERIAQGENAALISEAGMPGISDPGYALVREARVVGCEVTCVPGPSAVLTALVLSGLPAHAFHYVGFLPRRAVERRRTLARLADEADTVVCFESPHRLVGALRDVAATFGERRPMAVGRELTKRFEDVTRGTVAEVLQRFEAERPRGEFTLVLGGLGGAAPGATTANRDTEDLSAQPDSRRTLAIRTRGTGGMGRRRAVAPAGGGSGATAPTSNGRLGGL